MSTQFDRRILVTGASDGIGGATCRKLAADAQAAGQSLAIAITTTGKKGAPDALIGELESLGARVLHLAGDLGDAGFCVELARQALAFCGGMDVFVSNAGAVAPAKLSELSTESWDRLFDVDTRPTFLISRELFEALSASRGNIVAVGSTSGLQPHCGHGSYSAAKAALTMLVRQLAQEWAHAGIRANMVAPGLIETPLTAGVYANAEVRAAREKIVPLGRIGRPEDVAEAIAYFASPAASYVTGQVLAIDGGIAEAALLRIPGLPAATK